ncbi:MAG: cell division protein SepF, partial [bacterium]|nr:cell division protein SepF [bacterium]
VLDFFGFDVEDEQEELSSTAITKTDFTVDLAEKRKQQITDIKQRQTAKVVVIQPRSFDDVQTMVEHIKVGRPLIINLDACETKSRQRVVDFMSGASYGSGGKIQKISEWIILSVPANIQVENILADFDEEPIVR